MAPVDKERQKRLKESGRAGDDYFVERRGAVFLHSRRRSYSNTMYVLTIRLQSIALLSSFPRRLAKSMPSQWAPLGQSAMTFPLIGS